MDWQGWLGEVFKQDLFDGYLAKLEGRFRSAEEIVQHYVKPGPGGPELDPCFFTDLGIKDVKHRELFKNWFRQEADSLKGMKASKPPGLARLEAAGFVHPKRDEVPQGLDERGLGHHRRRLRPVLSVSQPDSVAAEWLRGVDWSTGVLGPYRDRLAKTFAHPGQAAEAYIAPAASGRRPRFDSKRFCEDLGVEDEHRWLFEAWFLAAFDAEPLAPVAPATSPPHGRQNHLDAWLAESNWCLGELHGHYGEVLRENFDQPSQIVDAYVRGSVFNHEQFFEDIGVEDERHRELFRAGLIAHLGLQS